MRIGIDAIHLSRGSKGVARFERSLIQALVRQTIPHEVVVFLDRDHRSLDLPDGATITYVSAPSRNLLTWEQLQLPQLARRHRIDCLLTLTDRLPLAGAGPVVLYLFEAPDFRRRLASATGASVYQRTSDLLTRLLFPRSLASASRIAAASQATARDLQARYRLPSSKIDVVYSAADEHFRPPADPARLARVRAQYDAPAGYVLHFSTGDARDNTPVALAAFARARLAGSKKLIVAGGGQLPLDGKDKAVAELSRAGRITQLGFLTGQTLVELYQAADVYVDPSLFEGFGFQVVEAMACGVPVVCSNTTSLPEVVGDAALTYAPDDIGGFAQGLETTLHDPGQAARMRAAGLRQASRFSWQETARQLMKACERAVG